MVEGWDLSELWPEFEAEVEEHLTRLEEGLLALESRSTDMDLVHELFRSAHTIKGAARTMGVNDLAEVALRVENALRDVREGKRAIDPSLISDLLGAVDTMRSLLQAHKPLPPSETPPPGPSSTEQQASETTPEPSSTASGQEIRPSDRPSQIHHVDMGETIRLQPQQVQQLTRTTVVLRMEYMRLREVYKHLERELRRIQLEQTPIGPSAMPTTRTPARTNGPDTRLDRYEAAVVLEWTRHIETSFEDIRRHFLKTVEDMGTTLQDLEDQILDFRLVPFTTLVPFLRRIVRDAAHNLGKRVTLHVEGENTLIDRQLVGPLQDIFIHLLRNAVDHGIEPPDVRQQKGKPVQGTIWIRLHQTGDHIHIDVEDDGAGVNIEKVREKAMERGFLRTADSQEMAEDRLLQLLFYPGFSTRAQTSAYSGQGVGLDVVAQTIRRLGGDIHMQSTPDKGTRIVISLPLNLALVDAIIVRVGATRVALPVSHVKSVLKEENTPIFDTPQGPRVLWQDILIPLVNWCIIFPDVPVNNNTHIVVLSSHNRFIAVRGGTVEDTLILALHPLPELLSHALEIYGASILGDGSVVFLLTVDSLMAKLAQAT